MFNAADTTNGNRFGPGRLKRTLRNALCFVRWLTARESLPPIAEPPPKGTRRPRHESALRWLFSSERLPTVAADIPNTERPTTHPLRWLMAADPLPDATASDPAHPVAARNRRSLMRWIVASDSLDSPSSTDPTTAAEEK